MFIKILNGQIKLHVEETEKTAGGGVGDLPSANNHEPLDASHGAQIIAKEVGAAFLIFFVKYDEFSAALQSKTGSSYNDW